jgi:DNA-binding transcriptional MocR family regulator
MQSMGKRKAVRRRAPRGPSHPSKRDANLILAARVADIEPFHVMDVQERADRLEASGRRIVHMEIGQPDFPAPPLVADAAIDAIRTRRLGYTASIGIYELRRAISDYYRERLGVTVSPSRIVVTAGASGAFLLTLAALVSPGDEVLLPDPCYPCNRHFVRLFEGRPLAVPVDEAALPADRRGRSCELGPRHARRDRRLALQSDRQRFRARSCAQSSSQCVAAAVL